jgi:hypothetical protein
VRAYLRRLYALLRNAICPSCGEIAAAPADDAIAAASEIRPVRPAQRPMVRLRRRVTSPFGQGPGRSRRRGPSRPGNRLSR